LRRKNKRETDKLTGPLYTALGNEGLKRRW